MQVLKAQQGRRTEHQEVGAEVIVTIPLEMKEVSHVIYKVIIMLLVKRSNFVLGDAVVLQVSLTYT